MGALPVRWSSPGRPQAEHGHVVERLRRVSAALAAALASVSGDMRATAWQDGLDVLAVMAALKPVCIIGRGARDEDWIAAVRAIAARAALPAGDAAAWDPEAADGALPRWYIEATALRRARRPVLYIGCDDAAMGRVAVLSAKGRVGIAEEAALLGYPPCCVAQHHSQALALERLAAELTERLAKGDAGRMARMIEAGAAPLPSAPADWKRYAAASAMAPAAGTSIAMCAACAADLTSPAQALSRRYQALAMLAHYSSL
jgi:hypothetical protein